MSFNGDDNAMETMRLTHRATIENSRRIVRLVSARVFSNIVFRKWGFEREFKKIMKTNWSRYLLGH